MSTTVDQKYELARKIGGQVFNKSKLSKEEILEMWVMNRMIHGAGSSIIPPTAEQKKALQDWAHLSQNDAKESFIHLVVDKLELVKDDKDLPKAKEWLAELK